MVSVNQPYTTQKGNSSRREQIPLKGVCATIAPAGDAGSQNECGCAFQFTLLKFTPFKVITIETKNFETIIKTLYISHIREA